MRKSYAELLKDPRWQKKRLEVMSRDNFTCVLCGEHKQTLTVHHIWYTPNVDPWNYDDDCYATLCESCHNFVHDELPKCVNLIAINVIRKGMSLIDVEQAIQKHFDEIEKFNNLF